VNPNPNPRLQALEVGDKEDADEASKAEAAAANEHAVGAETAAVR